MGGNNVCRRSIKGNRRRPVRAVFNYLTKDPEGKRKEGEIRADSLDTAIQKLSAKGQRGISLKEGDETMDSAGP
jgi:Type II secretory pathway, component PulF